MKRVVLKDLDGDGIQEILVEGEEETCDSAEAVKKGLCQKKAVPQVVWKLQGDRYADTSALQKMKSSSTKEPGGAPKKPMERIPGTKR